MSGKVHENSNQVNEKSKCMNYEINFFKKRMQF